MGTICKTWLALTFAVSVSPGFCQDFIYVEAGLAGCPAAPAPSTAAAREVPRGTSVPGRIRVSCGFDQGSYTVTLNSSDPNAKFSPRSFLVNFGRVVGNGVFAVSFSTVGLQSVSTSITSNMGSPPVRGQFVSAAPEFNVVGP